MSEKISIDQLGDAITQELTLYHNDILEKLDKEAKKSMSQLVKDTKATAPVGKRSKHYRDSIKSKKIATKRGMFKYLWFVDGSDYRLTHLLNDGHALKDGGRYAGTKFLDKATDPIIEQYNQKAEEVIQNG